MSARKFRFGVSGRGDTLEQWRDFARKAEDLGYSTLVLPDHFTRQMAPLPALVKDPRNAAHQDAVVSRPQRSRQSVRYASRFASKVY